MKFSVPTIFVLACLMAVFTSCERRSHDATVATVNADSTNLVLLKEAYLYGYPLMVMNATMTTMTNVDKPINSGRLLAPLNQLVSAKVLFPTTNFGTSSGLTVIRITRWDGLT